MSSNLLPKRVPDGTVPLTQITDTNLPTRLCGGSGSSEPSKGLASGLEALFCPNETELETLTLYFVFFFLFQSTGGKMMTKTYENISSVLAVIFLILFFRAVSSKLRTQSMRHK